MDLVRPHRIGPWRRLFQWGTTLLMLAIPFVRMDGRSLLRFDLGTLSLQAGGRTFPFEELHLLLLLALGLVLFFLLTTLVLGRVWCGWACPQTALADMAEGFARLLGLRVEGGKMEGAPWRKALLHLFCLGVSLLVAANLVWYFVSPYEFFSRLAAGELGTGACLTLAAVGGTVYLDLAFVRRLLCREFCPYGRFQTVLVDPGTLTLRFPPEEKERCRRCNACVRACPMGIDIRRGFQVECINCGRCLDACREMLARRGEPGIIRYTFGTEGGGWKALLNLRIGLVLAAFAAVSATLLLTALHRPEATLKLARGTATARMLDNGRTVNFFTAYVGNRREEAQTFTLTATLAGGGVAEIRGPATGFELAPGERRRIDFAVVAPLPPSGSTSPVVFHLLDPRGEEAARVESVILTPPRE